MEYKVVYEYSAPTYYDYETNEELYDECQASIQSYWVCSWDKDEREILEWIEQFCTAEEAEEYKNKLEREK